MSPKEREVWITTLNYGPAREDAAETILDRVEALEAELAAARAARHCGVIVADGYVRRCLGCGDAWREKETKTDG